MAFHRGNTHRLQRIPNGYAGVGIANAESVELPVFKDQPYYVAFEDFVKILE